MWNVQIVAGKKALYNVPAFFLFISLNKLVVVVVVVVINN